MCIHYTTYFPSKRNRTNGLCFVRISSCHSYFSQTFDSHLSSDFRIPEWAEKALADGVMGYIAAFDYVLYSATPDLARFASGFLFKEILEHFTQKINATLDPDRSLWLYSGHDYSITNALNSLGMFNEVHHSFS